MAGAAKPGKDLNELVLQQFGGGLSKMNWGLGFGEARKRKFMNCGSVTTGQLFETMKKRCEDELFILSEQNEL